MNRVTDVHLVVPTRGDRPELLDISLQSLLEQSHPVRISIVAPESSTEALSARYGNCSEIELLPEQGAGLSAAINQAWKADGWSSDLTGWLGDDDALPPDSVANAVSVLRANPGAAMVHGRCLIVDESGSPVSVTRNGRIASLLVGYGMNLIAQPGCLFRTSALREVGGLDEQLRYAMDVDLYARLRRVGSIASSPRQLGVFREHESGLSTRDRASAATEARIAQEREHSGTYERVLDSMAAPATKVLERITRRLPPPPNTYWRPTGSTPLGADR